MDEPQWLSRLLVDVIHSELIREHGGSPGTRAGGDDLIESAISRPRQRYSFHPESELPQLAAAYLFGLVKNHGYIDGNKRVGFACAATFLVLNGVRLTASEVSAFDIVSGTAEGRFTEEDVAAWIREHTAPL
jgi:death on curing protein